MCSPQRGVSNLVVRKLPFINRKSGRVELLRETLVAEEVRDRNVADKPLK